MKSNLMTRRSVALSLGAGIIATVSRAQDKPATSASSDQIATAGWGALISPAPLAVALELGLFAKHGLNINDVANLGYGGTGIRNLVAAEYLYSEASLAGALVAYKQGVDVRIVTTHMQTSRDFLWVTLPNSSVRSIKDMPGTSVWSSVNPFFHFAFAFRGG